MKKQVFKSYWCIYSVVGDFYDYSSISSYRTICIQNFISGSLMTWKEARTKHGWACVKVNITVESVV